MFFNYFKISIRHFNKNKLYAFINAVGLSIGIAFCALIYLFILDEKSFDQFHVNKDSIFRINEERYLGKSLKSDDVNFLSEAPEGVWKSAYLPAPLAPTLKEEISEIKYATRFSEGSAIFKYKDKVFEEEITYTDADFFKMFSFKLLKGNPDKLFENKEEIILTESLASKYFDDEDPFGKELILDIRNDEKPYLVTGIIEDAPANSSLVYEALIPVENRPYYERSMSNWRAFSYPTFIQLREEASLDNYLSNLNKFTEKYFTKSIESWREREELGEEEKSFALGITNLNDVHLDTSVSWKRTSDPKYSYILGGIALLILVIAGINYVSLALTSSGSRKLEVGIRKVVGAERRQVLFQFAMESQLLAFVSMIVGLVLIFIFLPYFNEFTGKEITLEGTPFFQVVGFIILVTIILGVIAGSYPAIFLSGYKPISVLKSGFTSRLKSGFTKPLVVLQFTLSAFMIISSLVMFRQMNYISTKDLGYNEDQVLVIPTYTGWSDEGEELVSRFRTRFAGDPEILSISGTSSSFNRGWSKYGYKINGQRKSAYVYRVDPEYINTLDIEMKEGRNFDFNRPSDAQNTVIVNESLVEDMGWEDPLNERLDWREDSVGYAVIGVVKDYHFLSLEYELEPMFLHTDPEDGKITTMLVKISPDNISGSVDKLQEAWGELSGDKPFDYSFLDDDVARQYESYQKWMNIMSLSTFFAILIACLGLFGLAGINAVNRTKEVGIRKVMGAGINNILYLMNRQYVLMALIAFVIAVPASWYVMDQWLNDFRYAITISWDLFLISILAGLFIAILTVSYHAVKAALINPAETLKYE